jgi:hypothetical protein
MLAGPLHNRGNDGNCEACGEPFPCPTGRAIFEAVLHRTRVVNVRSGEAYDVYIGRQNRFPPFPRSRWANPYKIGPDGDRAQVIDQYAERFLFRPDLLAAVEELRSKTLACWCAPEACHGDVLAEPANASARTAMLPASSRSATRPSCLLKPSLSTTSPSKCHTAE